MNGNLKKTIMMCNGIKAQQLFVLLNVLMQMCSRRSGYMAARATTVHVVKKPDHLRMIRRESYHRSVHQLVLDIACPV